MSQSGSWLTSSGPGAIVQTLTGNTGGPVGPNAGNINVIGAGNIVVTGFPGLSELIISEQLPSAQAFQTNSGVASPDAFGLLNVLGTGGITTSGSGNTVTIDGSTITSGINTIDGNSGSVTGSIVTIEGGNSITTSGVGTILTVNVSGTTNHAVQVGNPLGSISSIAVGTTGQVLTGVTGASPTFQAPAASSISITGDSGGALTGAAFTFTGGTTGLTFAGAGSTETLGGKLIVANGGTNSSSFNINGVVISGATTTSALTSLTLTNGQVVIGSTGAAPSAATLTAGANISITNAANSITIAANATSVAYNYVTVNHAASPYTALSTDYYISADVTAGVITILLPNAPTVGRAFVIKDKVGLAATSNITVTTVGGAVTIDGATTFIINTAYQAASLIFGSAGYEVY